MQHTPNSNKLYQLHPDNTMYSFTVSGLPTADWNNAVIDKNGIFYMFQNGTFDLYKINLTTLELVGPTTFTGITIPTLSNALWGDIVIDPITDSMYVWYHPTAATTSPVGLYKMNLSTNVFTGVGTDSARTIGTMFFNDQGKLYGYGAVTLGGTQDRLMAISTTTGNPTVIGTPDIATSQSDGCNCPNRPSLTLSVTASVTKSFCGTASFNYTFGLRNPTGVDLSGLVVRDTLSTKLSWSFNVSTLQTSLQSTFGGSVSVAVSSFGGGTNNVLAITGLTVPVGYNTFNAQVTTNGTFTNGERIIEQAYLTGIPSAYGALDYSDDPTTLQFKDTCVAVFTVTTTCGNLSGTVYNDVNGIKDNAINGTGRNNPSGTQVYASLINGSGNVVATVAVNSNGTYSFIDVANGTYTIRLSTNIGTVGSPAPTVALPTGWVNTGEGTSGSGDGTINGIQSVTVSSADVTNLNFGIQAIPTAVAATASSQVNPGGTNQVTVTSTLFAPVDSATGTLDSIVITAFPSNATTIVINGTSYTSGTFPAAGVKVPTNTSGNPTQSITVDPAAGAVTVSIPYKTVDNAGFRSSNTANIDLPFTTLTFSGTVFDDRGGLTDGVINGTGIGNPSTTQLYANLTDSATGLVVVTATVNTSTGAYSLSPSTNSINTTYFISISTTQGVIGNTPPSAALPSNWVNTGDNFGSGNVRGSGNETGTSDGTIKVRSSGSDITSVNFGIDQRPAGTDKTATSQVNPGGTVKVQTPSLAATDLEDGAKGTGSWFIINTLPTKGILYYNNVAITAGDTIKNYDSTKLTVDPTFNGSGTVTFTFTSLDSAKIGDASPNTITMPFTSLTIGGTVFDDRGGLTDGTINGSGLGNPSTTQLYANLVNVATGNVVNVATVTAGTGVYTISDSINASTAYRIVISTTQGTIGSAAPSASLPTNWVNVGEQFGTNNSAGTGIETGTPNGTILVTTGASSNIASVNFGIDQRPAGTDKTAASQVNPGGTVKVQTPSLAGTDLEDGTKGTGSWFIISSLPTNATLYYNNIAVTAGDTIKNYDSTKLTVDPTFNGSGSVSFTFTSLDSAKIGDASPNTITMPFTSLTIGGTVFDDRGGLTDGTINGSGLGNPSSTQLYANLVDSATGIVRNVVAVTAGTGVYTISDSVNANTGYQIIISTTQGTIGSSAPSANLPTNWVNVGEQYGSNNASGTGIESGTPNGIIRAHTISNNITSINFGIDQRPVGTDKTAASQVNPGGTVKVQTPSLAATDLEDGTKGTGSWFIISSLPVNGTLYYNNVALASGDTIRNFDSTLLKVDPTFTGAGTITFTYTTLDSALKADLTPNTITMPFTGINISGTLYNDPSGLVNGVVDGTPTDTASSSTLYAYLVNGSGTIIGKDTLNTGNGTYQFNNIDGNTAYTVRVSTTNLSIGASGPSSANLPSGWASVGEAYGSNNNAGSGNESGTPNTQIAVTTIATDVTGVNFGIERTSLAYNKTYSVINPNLFNVPSGNSNYPYVMSLSNASGTSNTSVVGSNSTVMPGKVSGSDPEDGNYSGTSGSNGLRTLVLTILPDSTNDVMVYNGTVLKPGDNTNPYWNATNSRYEIPSFNANLLEIYIRKNGHTNTSFDYAWLDSAGVIGTSATYSVSGYGPLPVSLLNNQAQWKEKDGQVTWITASEINTDRFEIERSFDGQLFEKIGEVSAQGNSNTIKSYEYTDKGVKENVASKVYYRIRMVDKDETYTYSSVMELTQEKTTQVAISVYPNPSMNETTITIEQDKQESYQISIIDITGKEVFKGTTNSTSKQTVLDIQSLSAGVYQIIITTNNNRFIKQLVKVNN